MKYIDIIIESKIEIENFAFMINNVEGVRITKLMARRLNA